MRWEGEAVGIGVTRFGPGDEVFGSWDGSYAEYTAAAQNALAPKPANLTFEQAAAVPMAGLVALQAVRDHGGVRAGHTVLINGASGGIDTFAVQIPVDPVGGPAAPWAHWRQWLGSLRALHRRTASPGVERRMLGVSTVFVVRPSQVKRVASR